MDYSKLTDKDINKLVAFALGCKEVVPDIFMSDDRRYEFDKPKNKSGNKFFFDPCNNPADAWPIITANKISIYAMSEADKRGGWGAEAFHPNDAYSFNDNPLRAAMIVFLMMQELPNVPANSTGSDLR
ncbi:phage protein NinX family protein [Citrobacter amalonaticus]